MDGLSIITGISMTVFLLFYLAFNLNDKNKILLIAKGFLIVFGLFILSYIPATTISLDRDCGILSNGSYVCYLSNGSQVSSYGTGTTQVGSGFSVVYISFLYLLFGFLAILGLWKVADLFKNRRFLK